MKKEHLDYIDQLKGFAMILVVWGHCGLSYFYDTLYYLHLPVFIMITGMLLRYNESGRTPLKTIRKLCGTLMYPFFTFGIISIFVFACMNAAAYTEFSLQYRVKEIFTLGYDACWFLPALFLGESAAIMVLYFCEKGKNKGWLRLAAMIIILIIAEVARQILWRKYGYDSVNSFLSGGISWSLLILSRSLMFSFFILLGYVIFPFVEKLRKMKKWYVPVIAFFLFGIMVFVTRRTGFVDLRLVNWNNLFLYLSCSILISLAAILFFAACPVKSRLLNFFGKHSLVIMGVHMSMQKVWLSGRLLGRYAPQGLAEKQTVYSIMVLILTCMLTVPEIYVFDRAFPFVLNWSQLKQVCLKCRVFGGKHEKESLY